MRALRSFSGLFLAATVILAASSSSVGPVSEEQVRAAFLFQLGQYVQWPNEAFSTETSSVGMCVFGADSLVGVLGAIASKKTIQGRSVSIRKIGRPAEMSGCHLVFIGFSGEKQLRETFAGWTYPPTLLVGEAERFAQIGGIVNLIFQGGRVSFEINTATAARAHLGFRSQLLRFASIVSDEPRKRQ
jgi:hypothetical protein